MSRRPLDRLVLATVITASVAAGAVAIGPPGASAATTTSITVNGTGGGRVYDGVGAASGGGGNSRLLIDYPQPQRGQILDYLFKPGYGANLQTLKIELGGDTNSTDGAEPSYQHSRGVKNCRAGYQFWIAQQARLRNPDITLLGLAWGAPGWVGNGYFWSQDMVDYYIGWLDCAKNTWGLDIDYVGGWNEKNSNRAWFLNLDAALRATYPNTRIVADDSNIVFADKLVNDAAYRAAVDVIGAHYPCGWLQPSLQCPSSANAIATGKPLWASEGGSQDVNTGNAALIRQLNRGYLDGRYTGFSHWPLIAALYPNLPFANVGPISAGQPWSGNYAVGRTTWALAQYTQVTAPGWSFIDSGSGYLGGNRTNGSFVSLRSPSRNAWSSIVETSTANAPQTLNFAVTGGLPTDRVRVFATNLASNSPSSQQFARQADITPVNGRFSVTLPAGWVYSFTTLTGQGKGGATPPAARALALPYRDSFDAVPLGGEAKYLSDMQGAFEARACLGGRGGRCIQQVAPTKPILWQGHSESFAIAGDSSWRDYTVSADVLMQQAGTTFINGRISRQQRPQGNESHYQLRLADTGAWSVVRSTIASCQPSQDCAGTQTVLARGSVAAPGLNTWHTLSLGFAGSRITAGIDGRTVGTVTDGAIAAGNIGIGVSGYQLNQFDNLSVTGPATPPPSGSAGQLVSGLAGLCAENQGGVATNGNPIVIAACGTGSGQRWTYAASDRTLRVNGKCADVNARRTANETPVQLWDCNGGTNQTWQVGPDSSLVNPASGRCLDDPARSRTPGTQLIIFDCNGAPNQTWDLP